MLWKITVYFDAAHQGFITDTVQAATMDEAIKKVLKCYGISRYISIKAQTVL